MRHESRRSLAFSIAMLSLGLGAAAHAATIQATYQISGTGFDPAPTGSASTSVEGIYTFTFDSELLTIQTLVPDEVIGLDITGFDGHMTDYDETNSGVRIAVNSGLGYADVTIGGLVSGIPFMVGLSDDFFIGFRISLADCEVLFVNPNLTYVTTSDPFYTATSSSVVLLSSVGHVPGPPAWLLLASTLATWSLTRRLRRTRCGDPRAELSGIEGP